MDDFNRLNTTKLGYLGEEMVIKEFVHSKGYIPYITLDSEAHPIDVICMSGSSVWFLDIKTKPRRKYYPDQGMDLNDFNKYKKFPHPTYILFVDRVLGKIYGNWLHKLKYKIEGNIVYFPIIEMETYRNLTEEEIFQLKKHENSKYWGK